MLIGRLGQDPELKYTQQGTAVVSFSFATSSSWKDNDGNLKEKTEWHNIEAWKGLAEVCSNYLKKGSKAYLEGRLSTDSWEDENKKKHYKTKMVLDNMIMLDTKGTGSSTAAATSDNGGEKTEDDLPF